ncbi:unnamed protein product [Tuber melanosporum]|uniref:(Perigord truffle) hypothetical protein n=1 Tax=Tuber melanosporum (strain Mel28) TaxID=656061 RepID=D5GI07_TUBMM|nr:uncharacterized protein GSTUM_00008219001 [Tuber melanosporum]CAZ84150.1 unnamed protein product [Tuber melanosporum]
MVRTANTNSTNSSPRKNSDNEWTTIPVKPKLLVSFPKHPAEPTLHMLLLHSYFPLNVPKWIWHCYLDDEVLSPNPRGRERYMRIQKAFTKSGNFFAERGIVLHSLNISTSRIVELFFGSEEDLWKADALVEEYSRAMTGADGYIRRKENIGKMVCHGVYFLEQFTGEFVGRWNLKEERLRELEDMNPVFDSNGKRVLYRIRYVHYMSSQASSEQLSRTGATWAVTFSDFRVAECFIDGHAEFNFFMDPCSGGLKWYQDNPSRFFHNPNGFRRSSGSSNGSGSVPGTVGSSGATTAIATTSGANKLIEKNSEGPALIEDPEQAKSTLDVKVETPADVKVTSIEQQKSEIEPIATATTGGAKQVVIKERPEVQVAPNTSWQTGSLGEVKATGAEQQKFEIQSTSTVPTDGVKEGLVVKNPEAQAPTNTFMKQATGMEAVQASTTEQQKLQPLQNLVGITPTAPIGPKGGEATAARSIGKMWGRRANNQSQGDRENHFPLLPPPPPPYRKPIATQILSGAPPDTLDKFSPLVPSAPSAGVLRPPLTEDAKRQYPINPRRPGAKVTPLAKEPTCGNNDNNNSAPASALVDQTTTAAAAITTATKQSYHQHRLSNPRQNINRRPSDTVPRTATTAPTGVSVSKGGANIAPVNASQPKIEKIYTPEVLEKRRLAKLATKKKRADKKRADKKAGALEDATGATGCGSGGEGEVKVEGKEAAQGVVIG